MKLTLETGPNSQVGGDLFVVTLRLSEPNKMDSTHVFAFTQSELNFMSSVVRAVAERLKIDESAI